MFELVKGTYMHASASIAFGRAVVRKSPYDVVEKERTTRIDARARHNDEEAEFQRKVGEKFVSVGKCPQKQSSPNSTDMLPGYSPDFIVDFLKEKTNNKKTTPVADSDSIRISEPQLVLEMARPTKIRVKIEHLYPETLDYYDLP